MRWVKWKVGKKVKSQRTRTLIAAAKKNRIKLNRVDDQWSRKWILSEIIYSADIRCGFGHTLRWRTAGTEPFVWTSVFESFIWSSGGLLWAFLRTRSHIKLALRRAACRSSDIGGTSPRLKLAAQDPRCFNPSRELRQQNRHRATFGLRSSTVDLRCAQPLVAGCRNWLRPS